MLHSTDRAPSENHGGRRSDRDGWAEVLLEDFARPVLFRELEGGNSNRSADDAPMVIIFWHKDAYTVDSIDLNGTSPNTVANRIVALSFYTCVAAHQTSDSGGLIMSTIDNANFRALEMGFGGAAGNAAQIGWTDENNLAYFNGTSWIETNLLFDYKGYDQVSLAIDTAANTWSLSVNRGLNGYATENVISNLALFTPLGSSFGDITFTANEDPDDGTAATANGLAKTYFDNFAFSVVPEPSTALLGLLGGLGLLRRRR